MKTLSGVKYLSPKEVAEITQYSEAEIRKFCREGALEYRQRAPGCNINIPEHAIDPWLQGKTFYGGGAA